MGEFLLSIWTYFATNILTQPAYLIGLMTDGLVERLISTNSIDDYQVVMAEYN